MAGQFEAEILAKLNKSAAESDMTAFLNQKRKVDVEVNLKTGNVNIANFLNQLQSQFQRAGQQGGQNFGRAFNSAISNINVRNVSTQISEMQQLLENGFHFDQSSIDVITKNIDNLDVAIKKITTDLNRDNGNVRIKVDGLDELGRAVTVIQEVDNATGTLKTSTEKITQSFDDISRVTSQAEQWGSKLKAFENQFKSLLQIGDASSNNLKRLFDQVDFSNITNQADLEAMISNFRKLEEEGNRLNALMNKSWAGKAIEKLGQNLKDASTDVDKLETKFSQLGKSEATSQKIANSIQDIRNKIKDAENAINPDEKITKYNEIRDAVKQLGNEYQSLSLEQKNAFIDVDKETLGNRITSWFNANGKAAKAYKAELVALKEQLDKVTNKADLQVVNKNFQNLKSQAAAEGNIGNGVFATLVNNVTKLSPLFGIGSMISVANRGLRDMYNNVVQIDTAMTELKKVTDETSSTYDKYLDNVGKQAQEIGTTVSDFITSTADFARLGYSFSEAQDMAKVANIYKVVGDDISDINEATQSVISTQKAFGISTEDSMTIVDKFNEVSNNFAISSGGIGEAMTRSSSSLAAANNTLDESIALITAANTVVQDPSAVGNAFKTISMRIRGAKTELEAAGEDTEGMAESTAKLREEIQALSGVDIMIDDNTFKSTYQIMDELSVKWADLTDIQQASITELLAGKRQGNVVSSLMTNFDIAREALETASKSEGSAMKEHERWMESLEAKTLKLKAAWQEFSNDFMQSDFLKGGLDFATGFVNLIDSIIDRFGALGTAIGGGALFTGIKSIV